MNVGEKTSLQDKAAAQRTAHGYRALYAAILIGTLLRLLKLGSQSIWGDESLTLLRYTAGNDFSQLWGHIWQTATHPPLYFLLAHYWFLLGKSEFMLRFPSAVFGIASIPVAYALASRLFGRIPAAICAFVVALSPIGIWYSQEARMYSMQIFLCLLSTLYFVKLWQDRRPKDGFLYVVFLSAGLFTHIATIFLVAAHGIFALAASVRNPKRLAAWIGIQALVLFAFSPWMVNFMHAREDTKGEIHIGYQRPASLMDLGYGLYTFSVGYSVGPSVAELHENTGVGAVKPYIPVIALTGFVFGLLGILGIVQARRTDPWAASFLLTILLTPMVLAGIAAYLPHIPLNPRYMLISVIPYWIFTALGIQYTLWRSLFRIVPVAALILTCLAISNYYFQPKYAKQDMRSAVAVVNQEARPGDAIVISSIELGGPFKYYFKRRDLPYFGYPSVPGFVKPQNLHNDLARLTLGKKRVWLILGRTWSSDPQGLIRKYFDGRSTPIEKRHFAGVTVLCYPGYR